MGERTEVRFRHSNLGKGLYCDRFLFKTRKIPQPIDLRDFSAGNERKCCPVVPEVAAFQEAGSLTVTRENSLAPSMSRNAADVDVINS